MRNLIFLMTVGLLSGCVGMQCGYAGPNDQLAYFNYLRCLEDAKQEEYKKKEITTRKSSYNNFEELQKKRSVADNKKWKHEVQQAKEAAKLPSKYPDLAWLDGIWCKKSNVPSRPSLPEYKSRWDVTGSNQIRKVDYSYTPFGADYIRVTTNTFTITAKGNLFEIQKSKSSDTRVIKYKKASDTQFTQVGAFNQTYIKCTSKQSL